MKILLAIDGSECSKAAVNSVAERPWPQNSEIKIISVMEIPYAPTTEAWALPEGYYKELERVAREHAEEAVKQAVERFGIEKAAGIDITAEIFSGSPRNAILDEAERWDADLIVLGSHGYRGWQRFLLGSVSQAVATHAPCSVEIARHKPVTKK